MKVNHNRLFWLSFVALFTLYLLLAFAISEVTPFKKGPAEGINLDYIEFIATWGRLPITYVTMGPIHVVTP